MQGFFGRKLPPQSDSKIDMQIFLAKIDFNANFWMLK